MEKGEREKRGEGERYLAPEGRHVYRRAGHTKYIKAPEEGNRGSEKVGKGKVGKGERERERGGRRDCFSLQRSVMSIEGRLVQEQHSSGVQCGGCLNQDVHGLKDSQDSRREEYLTQGRKDCRGRRESGKVGKGEGRRRERSLAPEGRHVYRKRDMPKCLSPRGAICL